MDTYRGWLCILGMMGALLGCDSGGDGAEMDAGSGSGTMDAARAGGGGGSGHGGMSATDDAGGASDGGKLTPGTGGRDHAGAGGQGGEGDPTGQGGTSGSGATGGIDDGGLPIDESAELYDEARVPRFDITLPQASIDMLNADPRTYAPGELRYGDEVVTNIGVRIKGEYSHRTLDGKSAFKLKFDEFVDKQEFRGLRRMTLNNMIQDFSFIAERLSYALYRAAGLPAPRCNSALVYVNDQFYGVYANVETEDKTFLRRWFEDEDGNLYEEGQVDFEAANVHVFELETNEMENDRSDLVRLIEVLESTTPETFMTDMSTVLDLDHFLRFTALEGLVNQWDMYGYTHIAPNNFRIYNDPTSGQFVFLPWGMDLSMKPFDGREHIEMFATPATSGRIFVRCLDSEACRAAYIAAVQEMLEVYEATDLEAKAEAYFEQIREHIMADPRKEQIMPTVEEAYGVVRANIRARPDLVRADLAEELN